MITRGKITAGYRGGAIGENWGNSPTPLLTKVIFVNRLKPMRKLWGMGG